MQINCLDILPLYKSQRHLYIGLKHLVDDEVAEALKCSDKAGTDKAKKLEQLYKLTHIRKVLHELYGLVRKHRIITNKL